ncbi:MAG: hypothetical protein HY321_05820, partial [Armatimonadetes bacterium]|nr:hypothetical protein [Armatimonadota bacterium]
MSVSRLGWMVLVGWSAAMPAVSAAEPDVVWPTEWTAFGPAPKPPHMGLYTGPDRQDLVPGDALRAIPKELSIGGRAFAATPLRAEDGVLDLRQKMGGASRGWHVYLMAPITVPRDMTVQIGAGADWWMQWWVDGRPVYDTLKNDQNGNGTTPITSRDHVFSVTLTKGTHVLAVAVFSGPYQFALALASPDELRASPRGFREMMEAGKRKYNPARELAYSISFPSARADFQRALAAAASDEERAEARLAIIANVLDDIQETNMAAVRRECAAVLALAGARSDQRTQAALRLGEAWLREDRCELARQEFARASSLSSQSGSAAIIRLAVARSYAQQQNGEAALRDLAPLTDDPDLDPLLRFQARSLKGAVAVAPRIRTDHPRLFFNAETWPAVKARLEANAEAFSRLKEQARSLPDRPEVRDWGNELMAAALVYRATGDPALLVKVRALLRATVDAYVSRQGYNSGVESRVGCFAALDWVWNDLPPAEREGLARDLLRYVYRQHTEDLLKGLRTVDRDPVYYAPAMFWYAGLVLLDQQADAVDYARVLAVLGRGYDNHVTAAFAKRAALMAAEAGEAASGPGYSFAHLPTPTWSFLHCWRSAVGPIPPEWTYASGFSPEYVLRNALGFKPEHYRHFGYSKSWRPSGGWKKGALLYHNLEQFIHFFSKTQPRDAAIAGYLRERMAEAGCTGEGTYAIDPFLLDLEGAPPPELPDDLPLAHHYSINNRVIMSSGFGPNATHALFSCGTAPGQSPTHTPSQHFDAGHFTIFKKGYLALDSGSRALGQDTMPDQSASGINYDSQSVAHNTVLIRMEGEVMP